MKFVSTLALCLPAVSALPQTLQPAVRGIEIRDEARLEQLRESHAQTIQILNGAAGEGLEKRQGALAAKAVRGLAGLFLIPLKQLNSKTMDKITDKAVDALGNDDQEILWHNHDQCRTYFETQGGGNCETRTYDRGSGDRTATHKDGALIQYTATKEHAWGGIPGTSTCAAQGLCNPQFVFYRDSYNLVLNTWESQGEISYCQYSGGANCRGLCSSGVKNQFSSGGVTWGGDCAIPCEGDANLPSIEIEIDTGIF
ncbi:hypothetical protein ACJ41O_012457 [Fusarium nematophilum]